MQTDTIEIPPPYTRVLHRIGEPAITLRLDKVESITIQKNTTRVRSGSFWRGTRHVTVRDNYAVEITMASSSIIKLNLPLETYLTLFSDLNQFHLKSKFYRDLRADKKAALEKEVTRVSNIQQGLSGSPEESS